MIGKKFSSSLVVVFLFLCQVLLWADTSDSPKLQSNLPQLIPVDSNLFLTQETSTANLNNEQQKLNKSSETLSESQLASMSVWELLQALEKDLQSSQETLAVLMPSSEKLQKELESTRSELLNSKLLLNSLRQALISNKDDTGEVIAQLGIYVEQIEALTEKVGYYEKRATLENTIGWTFTALGSIVGISGIIVAGIDGWNFNTVSSSLIFGGFGSAVIFPSIKIGSSIGLVFRL